MYKKFETNNGIVTADLIEEIQNDYCSEITITTSNGLCFYGWGDDPIYQLLAYAREHGWKQIS